MISLPNVEVKVESKGLRWFMDGLSQWLGVSNISREQGIRKAAALLTKRLIQFTPPLAAKGTSGGRQGSNARRTGEKAVQRDIMRAVRPMIGGLWDMPRMRNLIRAGDLVAINAILANMQWVGHQKGAKAVRWTPGWHRQARKSRGRVTGWTRLWTPDVAAEKAYIKKTQKNVGIARGGWAASAAALGLNPPDWIARHRRWGYFRDTLKAGGGVTIANQSPWADYDAQRICDNALRSVSRSMFQAVARETRRAHLLR